MASSVAHPGLLGVAPGARAGALPSGDPFVELRAAIARRDLPVSLAYDSAAWLQGLSARQPNKNVLSTHCQRNLPPALREFRVTRIWGALEPEQIDHLPVWSVPTLLAKMAAAPYYYRDWSNVMEWLAQAFERCDADRLKREIDGASDAARVRLAYLAHRADSQLIATSLIRSASTRALTYLGRRRERGRFVRDYNLVDSLLVPSAKPELFRTSLMRAQTAADLDCPHTR